MKQNKNWTKLREAVETDDPKKTAAIIVEVLLDDGVDTAEIAADFIENEVGRHDWVNNWRVIRERQEALAKVQAFLTAYGLVGDAAAVVEMIDRMAQENPGRWK